MTTVPDEDWKKSSISGQDSECVELNRRGAVRDSKNPAGPVLEFTGWASIAALTDLVRG